MICGLLTQQYLAVNDEQEATQSNSAVREFHQDVFCDVVSTRLHPQISFTCASKLPKVIGGKRSIRKFSEVPFPAPPGKGALCISSKFQGGAGPGGVLDISLGGEVRPGPSHPDPV